MRSPLLVPLVLLTLTLLPKEGDSSQQTTVTNHFTEKVLSVDEKVIRTDEVAESKKAMTKMTNNKVILSDDKSREFHSGDKVVLEDDESRVSDLGEKVVRVTDENVLKAVESNLLTLFGFTKRPRPRRNVVIPEAMKELYRKQTGLELETTNLPLPGRHVASANTVRTFNHLESSIDEQFRHQHRFRLSFDVDSIPKSERLEAAELHLSASGSHQILVHDIIRPGVRGKSKPITRIIDSRKVDSTNGQITLDVTPAVRRWISNPKENHGLLIVVQEGNGRVRLKRSVEQDSEWKSVQPVLYTYTDDGKHKNSIPLDKRAKRAVRKHRRKDGRDLCRRHEMYVDFSEVGWNDWIVAPPGYDAYYCAGDCPFPQADHLNSTNHAIVQTLVNSAYPSATPKACCVPTALTSISMLYVDDDNKTVLKNYQDMAILGCGCR